MSLLTGLISYYKLDGNSNDSIGSNNGTDTAISYSTSYGKINQGASFNGTNSTIAIGTLSSYSFIQNTGNFSISFWCKINSTSNQCIILGNNAATTVQKGLYIFQNRGTLELAVTNGISGDFTIDLVLSTFFTDTNWHYIIITSDYSSNLVAIYKDGALYISAGMHNRSLPTGNSSQNLAFGYSTGYSGYFYNGYLDEVGIWNRALSSTEVTQLYNGGVGIQYPFGNSTGMFFKLLK